MEYPSECDLRERGHRLHRFHGSRDGCRLDDAKVCQESSTSDILSSFVSTVCSHIFPSTFLSTVVSSSSYSSPSSSSSSVSDPGFMLRLRRSALTRRLWKSRMPNVQSPTPKEENPNPDLDSDVPGVETKQRDATVMDETTGRTNVVVVLKTDAYAVFESLGLNQLETLLMAVESRDDCSTGCIVTKVPSDARGADNDGKEPRSPSLPPPLPYLVCCRLWRWPTVTEKELKSAPFCSCVRRKDGDRNEGYCCNPYHWSRLTLPDPSSFKKLSVIVDYGDDDVILDKPSYLPLSSSPPPPPSSSSSSSLSDLRSSWCTVAYWEMRKRVGHLYDVDGDSLNIFQDLTHGSGLCLSLLQTDTSNGSVRKTRQKIGVGVTLSREPDGVWIYNRCAYPVFVKYFSFSLPFSDDTTSTSMTTTTMTCVEKLLPGYSLRIFDYMTCELLSKSTLSSDSFVGPVNPFCVQVSFVKGWGSNYSRQTVMQCPCWMEIILHVKR